VGFDAVEATEEPFVADGGVEVVALLGVVGSVVGVVVGDELSEFLASFAEDELRIDVEARCQLRVSSHKFFN
jgi:hypothetical protein